jgi:hypothetical protein|tara:strand:+ start:4765 stop:4911 length:147 start_codon:yes stop_codon:yes gene_type:complete
MKTIKQLPSGVYVTITKGRVNVYTQEEFNNLYSHNVWWNKIKSKYFTK